MPIFVLGVQGIQGCNGLLEVLNAYICFLLPFEPVDECLIYLLVVDLRDEVLFQCGTPPERDLWLCSERIEILTSVVVSFVHLKLYSDWLSMGCWSVLLGSLGVWFSHKKKWCWFHLVQFVFCHLWLVIPPFLFGKPHCAFVQAWKGSMHCLALSLLCVLLPC